MDPTARSVELRAIAQSVADAVPATVEGVVQAGSVTRGLADGSDIEILVVTRDEPELEECFSLAAAAMLADLGTWGRQGVPSRTVAELTRKPDRLAERLEEALTEPDPRRAVRVMTEVQAETVELAPDGPNINRARTWLNDALELLRDTRG